MALYCYQKRVLELVKSGKSVILQAPTGTGKTRAALAPFIESFFDASAEMFPRKCIYSVPMRVLANQFVAEHQHLAASYVRRHQRSMKVAIQTGEHPKDPTFLDDLIFATIDQSLSSALGVPYSQSVRRANLNAGAFYAAYLVFDEFHLFPSGEHGAQGALVATLQLLSRIKGLIPFVLMTATFSSTMLEELAQRLNAEVVTLSAEEYRTIASGRASRPRWRVYRTEEQPLDADAVLRQHHQPGVTRSIAICNQVSRAQALYQALRQHSELGDTEVMLIHSRFTPADRQAKEALLRREFGKTIEERSANSLILVATQVIEVGVDITCDRLHTEIAPANSIFQRAGRCARYPGEEGYVYVYPTPTRDNTRTGEPEPDYLPYPPQLCAQSWASFQRRNEQEIDFLIEQIIVDEVHTESDRALLEAMDDQQTLLWQSINAALETYDTSMRRELIRHIDSVTLVAGCEPEEVGNPFLAEGFSLHRGSIKGLWRTLQEYAAAYEPEEFADPPWTMAYPLPADVEAEDGTQLDRYVFRRLAESDASLLDATPVIVINSLFCAYDSEVGFRIVPPGEESPWVSAPGERTQGNRPRPYAYRLESYDEHIERMITIYRERFAADYAYIRLRMADVWGLPPDGLDEAIRVAIAGHDIAKLDERWQRWARAYQAEIGAPISPDFMAVHTDYEPFNPAHKDAQRAANRIVARPKHAGESAVTVGRIVAHALGDEVLARATLTAIARHHTTSTSTYDAYTLHSQARPALDAALRIAGAPVGSGGWTKRSKRGGKLDPLLLKPGDFRGVLLYYWIVRVLRLCDGLSQEITRAAE